MAPKKVTTTILSIKGMTFSFRTIVEIKKYLFQEIYDRKILNILVFSFMTPKYILLTI